MLGTGAVLIARPARALIAGRNPLAFPGISPRLNSTHPMAQGARLAAVAAPGGAFIDLLTGKNTVTTNGTLTTAVQGTAGPSVSQANGVWNAFSNSYSDGTPTSLTMAIIFYVPSLIGAGNTGNPFITYGNWNGNFGVGLEIAESSGVQYPGIYTNGSTALFNTAQFAQLVGHSYLLVINWKTTGYTIGMVDLGTGAISSGSQSGTPNLAPGSFTWGIGIGTAGGLNRPAGVNIAAVAYSVNNQLNAGQIAQWVQRPWDYWYAPNTNALLFSSLANSAGVPGTVSDLPMMGVGR